MAECGVYPCSLEAMERWVLSDIPYMPFHNPVRRVGNIPVHFCTDLAPGL